MRSARCVSGFNPRPPPERGATASPFSSIGASASFNPRPPPERGATHNNVHGDRASGCFNPRPPPERGATVPRITTSITRRVSIHAPLRREERPSPELFRCRRALFQSTPPSGERSDRLKLRSRLRGVVSIHAPLRREERPSVVGPAKKTDGVSIHAPLRREERHPQESADLRGERCFNPRPPPERGATGSIPTPAAASARFNPRPPPERGATNWGVHLRLHDGVSIHAPLRREERRRCSIAVHQDPMVSIHAPLRREERRIWCRCRSGQRRFQSTPPSGERSDICATSSTRWQRAVSIHAPLRREERRRAKSRAERIAGVSIHAPLRREERLV